MQPLQGLLLGNVQIRLPASMSLSYGHALGICWALATHLSFCHADQHNEQLNFPFEALSLAGRLQPVQLSTSDAKVLLSRNLLALDERCIRKSHNLRKPCRMRYSCQSCVTCSQGLFNHCRPPEGFFEHSFAVGISGPDRRPPCEAKQALVIADDAIAEAVECCSPDVLAAGHLVCLEPRPEFSCRFVAKGEHEYVPGRYALLHKVCNTLYHDSALA